MNYANYTTLVDNMKLWAKAYYKEATPIISDQEWDKHYKDISDFELNNPDNVRLDSPVGKVGYAMFGQSGITKHEPHMLSLKNAMTVQEALDIIETVLKPHGPRVVEYKADGVACRLSFIGCKFKQALTRGDGLYGEDITRHIDPALIGFPDTIDFSDQCFIDGELVIKYEDFDKLNEYRLSINQTPYKNTRNAVAGMLASDSMSKQQNSSISFLAYDMHDKKNNICWRINRDLLKKAGFELVDTVRADDFEKTVQNVSIKRDKLKYAIDGLVVKLDLYNRREQLGSNQHSPRWAFSYKFTAITAKTVLKSVDFTVGRTGQVTGMVHFHPVDIGGVTVTKSVIDSVERWIDLKPSVGAMLTISRRADVRPYVEACESVGGTIYPFAVICPWCNSKLMPIGRKIFCINDFCMGRALAHITKAVSKKALDIDDLSEQKVTLLYHAKAINCVTSLYKLTTNKLIEIGFTDYGATKLINEINNSKNTTLERIIVSFGIPLIGSTFSKEIVKHLKSVGIYNVNECIDFLMDPNKVLTLPIGQAAKEAINAYFEIPFYAMRTNGYRDIDFKIKTVSGSLNGHHYCITGTLTTITRSELEQRLLKAGATIQSSVTNKTNALITDDNPSPPWENMPSVKMQKAAKLGIRIITSQEALNMLL